MGSRAGGNSALELKHHVLNGRLAQAKKLLASTRISLEDCQDEDGNTALHWCAQGLQTDAETREVPDEEMLIFLLQNGAPKNRQNRIGETPLMGAVRMATLDPLRAEASPRAPRQPAGGELLRADGRAAGAGGLPGGGPGQERGALAGAQGAAARGGGQAARADAVRPAPPAWPLLRPGQARPPLRGVPDLARHRLSRSGPHKRGPSRSKASRRHFFRFLAHRRLALV
ncbi:unnamed protein product [Prorocentrum cordatum]|uniref:Uncharacterized protein n=1 Tax=Prorocentrum cordatum TaxID=2364126 RepID=A0ABN9S1W1_9DINO|nr:unnamed protein product [Polarella glacialis]